MSRKKIGQFDASNLPKSDLAKTLNAKVFLEVREIVKVREKIELCEVFRERYKISEGGGGEIGEGVVSE